MFVRIIDNIFDRIYRRYKHKFLLSYRLSSQAVSQQILPLGNLIPRLLNMIYGVETGLVAPGREDGVESYTETGYRGLLHNIHTGMDYNSEIDVEIPETVVFKSPQVSKKYVGNLYEITVYLTGITDFTQISINEFSESFEIKAYNPENDRAYFTIVEKPAGLRNARLSFADGKLRIVFR